MAINQAWFTAALTAAMLIAWLKLIALDGKLASAEPKTLRYRIFHAAARLARGGRRRQLKIAATWPWAGTIITAWERITALPRAPRDQRRSQLLRDARNHGVRETPATRLAAGPPSSPADRIKINLAALRRHVTATTP
jgi:hypothetical protein